jgi:hypothetical protein
MRRFLAFLFRYDYYLDPTDNMTVVRVLDGYRYHTESEFLRAVGLHDWDQVKEERLIYKDK